MLILRLMHTPQEIAAILLDIGAVKISVNPPFTWTSGIRSPIYCDNRKLISYPKERSQVVSGMIDLIKSGIKADFVGGTATAAIPWAAFVAHDMNLPMVYVRAEKKAHGAGKQVEGDMPPGQRVVIIEDLISTGGSSLSSAKAVAEECKGVVTDVVGIMTYELDEAENNFREAGLRLTTLTTFSHVLQLAFERGIIDEKQHTDILEFKKDPRGWADSHGY